MHRFPAKYLAHSFLQKASAGARRKDAHQGDAAEPYRRTVLTLGGAEMAEQIVTDAIVQACVLRCSSPVRGCGIPAGDLCLLAVQGAALAKQAEADWEKRTKIINAEDKSLAAAALGDASDVMMAHPLALQLRNLQSLAELGRRQEHHRGVGVPLMTAIAELGSFLTGEKLAAGLPDAPSVTDAVTSALGAAGDDRVRTQASVGSPAQVLLDAAAGARLLVVGGLGSRRDHPGRCSAR